MVTRVCVCVWGGGCVLCVCLCVCVCVAFRGIKGWIVICKCDILYSYCLAMH